MCTFTTNDVLSAPSLHPTIVGKQLSHLVRCFLIGLLVFQPCPLPPSCASIIYAAGGSALQCRHKHLAAPAAVPFGRGLERRRGVGSRGRYTMMSALKTNLPGLVPLARLSKRSRGRRKHYDVPWWLAQASTSGSPTSSPLVTQTMGGATTQVFSSLFYVPKPRAVESTTRTRFRFAYNTDDCFEPGTARVRWRRHIPKAQTALGRFLFVFLFCCPALLRFAVYTMQTASSLARHVGQMTRDASHGFASDSRRPSLLSLACL